MSHKSQMLQFLKIGVSWLNEIGKRWKLWIWTWPQSAILLLTNDVNIFQGLNDPVFQAVFWRTKKEIVGHALTQVQKSVTQAVDTLLDVMGNGVVESAKVSTAKTNLELEDLDSRIESLKKEMGESEWITNQEFSA